MKTTIKYISILLSFLVICLCNINKTYADDNKDISKGDDPSYQLETTYEKFNDNVNSIKTLIKNYNIKIKTEKRVKTIGAKPDKKAIVFVIDVPKNQYGDFIKDLKNLTKENKELDITYSYEPISLGANYRTLTLTILQHHRYANPIFYGLIVFWFLCIFMASLTPRDELEQK